MRSRVGLIALALLMGIAPAAAAIDPGGSFIDDDGSIHEPAIEAIRSAGITQGCDPVGDRFCPERGVTRAEMAAFIVRALGQSELDSSAPTFSDVGPGQWFYGWVEGLAALGISVGYGDGTYRPNTLVTRGEMSVFLVRALGVEPVDPVAGLFADIQSGAFYAGHTERLLELRVTNGCATSPLRFCPAGAVTRAEMASFVARAFELPLEAVPPRPSVHSLTLSLDVVASGLSQPLFVDAPAGDPRLFVVEKGGRIKVLAGGQVLATPFLDLSGLVSTDGERGLLGMAFHPGYAANGRFFVHYTDGAGANRIVEYAVSDDDPNRANPTSARALLTVPQPASNHNGGMIAFGTDGRMYVAVGDGGGAGDPHRNGQNPSTILGTVTALDVNSGATSLFAYGLRNPWRFSWDGQRMYIGDVGQGTREEVDVLSAFDAGANFGWPLMEGTRCFTPGCSSAGLTLPVLEYDHSLGCSITGGYVYRGTAIAELAGHYFYGDFCSGFVRSFRYTGVAEEHTSWNMLTTGGLVSFGTDGTGELYVVSIGGTVARIVRG
jgi:glucose/arabinose dehydrogenase